ncbi:MAG: hypothetical protein LBI18_11920, partial [Planctomycetaceae bacterium]|nr:hypothetical protein [Planctomycetaceae bacterium]
VTKSPQIHGVLNPPTLPSPPSGVTKAPQIHRVLKFADKSFTKNFVTKTRVAKFRNRDDCNGLFLCSN